MKKQLESPPNGEKLKEIRLSYNLSRKQLGDILGLSVNTIMIYEQRKTPVPCKHLKRINQLLSSEPPAQLTSDELRLLRTSRGLTQKQVAEAFGVERSTISCYERGTISIPDGLTECIKELAAPKDYLLPPVKYSARELLQRIDESRAEEREQWLCLADQVGPADLRKLRLSRGLSEDKLSEILGISKPILHFYEHGRRNIPKGLVRKILELCPHRTVTSSEITELRHALGLTQLHTAAALGLTQKAIGYYEAGNRRLRYNISKKIMEFYREQVENHDPDTPE